MNKIKFLILPVLLLAFSTSNVAGEVSNTPETPKVEARQLDSRAKVLAEYFSKYNSPLEYQAQNFVDAADTYGVDWKLVPAIAGVESTFGKHIPGEYNAWGWGIYGDNRLGFNSWKHGIYTVTGGLKKGYIDKGLTDPYSMNRVYAASPTWGAKVSHFLGDIEGFAAGYSDGEKSTVRANALARTYSASAQLALR